MRPYPDPRVIELEPAGGSGTDVDFFAHVANYGTQQCRCNISARVGDDPVPCSPGIVDLIPNQPPKLVRVLVPRPQLGELVPQFNNTTTLYDQTLRVEVTVGKRKRSMESHEEVYPAGMDSERYGIQQRVRPVRARSCCARTSLGTDAPRTRRSWRCHRRGRPHLNGPGRGRRTAQDARRASCWRGSLPCIAVEALGQPFGAVAASRTPRTLPTTGKLSARRADDRDRWAVNRIDARDQKISVGPLSTLSLGEPQ
jgi:hypothetical protein